MAGGGGYKARMEPQPGGLGQMSNATAGPQWLTWLGPPARDGLLRKGTVWPQQRACETSIREARS